MLNGLAAVTVFCSANKAIIVSSVATPALQVARLGIPTGPGMRPCPVAAGRVRLAAAAWGWVRCKEKAILGKDASMEYFYQFLFEGFPYRNAARRGCSRSGLYRGHKSLAQPRGRPRRTCWQAAGPRRPGPGEWLRPGGRPAGAQQGRSFWVGWLVDLSKAYCPFTVPGPLYTMQLIST